MTGNNPPALHKKGEKRILYELSETYKNPMHALREYVTNAIDALYETTQGRGSIYVLVNQHDRNVIVKDTGKGMNYKKLESLPSNTGNSEKYDKPDLRGEKAIGLLAFGSMGHRLNLVSKQLDEEGFGYLWYEKNTRKKEIDGNTSRITESELEKLFYGNFDNGTQAIINTNAEIFNRQFSPGNIKRFLQQTYTPILLENGIKFYVGDQKGGRGIQRLEALEYEGEELWEDEHTFSARTQGEDKEYTLDMLLTLDTDASNGSVGLFSKGVRVYNSISELDESLAKLPLWGCRQISGYINEPSLTLTLGRDGVNRNSNAYRALVESLEDLNDLIWPEIEGKIKNAATKKGANVVGKAWSLLDEAIKSDPVSGGGSGGGNSGSKGSSGSRSKNSENNKDQVKSHFGVPQIRDFGIEERGKRSTLDEVLGRPAVAINSSHPDYIESVGHGRASQPAIKYVLKVASGPVAVEQARRAVVNKRIIPESNVEFALEVIRREQDILAKAEDLMNEGGKR